MSAARLEVIKDDFPHYRMSRSMPAALEGLVSSENFEIFCTELDNSFQLIAAVASRGYCLGTKGSLVVYFIAGMGVWFFVLLQEDDDNNGYNSYNWPNKDTTSHRRLLLVAIPCIVLVVVVLCIVWCVQAPKLPTHNNILANIRADCEEMTRITPHVSFHLVTTGNLGSHVDYIAVSLALTAAANHRAVSALVTDDSATSIIEEAEGASSRNDHSIVYADVVAVDIVGAANNRNNGYQKISVNDEIELV